MPSGATQRSDTKVLLSLKRNTPGRLPFERAHACPSQRVHSKGEATMTDLLRGTRGDNLSLCNLTPPMI